MLGKRKRRAPEIKSTIPVASSDSLIEDAESVFRRHFEAHFKPLPPVKKALKVVEDVVESEDEDITDWDGISEPEGTLQDSLP